MPHVGATRDPREPHLHHGVRPTQVRPSNPSLRLTQVRGLHPR